MYILSRLVDGFQIFVMLIAVIFNEPFAFYCYTNFVCKYPLSLLMHDAKLKKPIDILSQMFHLLYHGVEPAEKDVMVRAPRVPDKLFFG